jgi:beta-galactosidase
MMFSSLGVEVPEASDPGLLRVERVDEASGARFVFLFNRTHEPVRTPVNGWTVVSFLVEFDGVTVTIEPNGVLVVKNQ